jgi:hypothetical protein
MAPNAPAAAPSTNNTNLPYGGGQAAADQTLGSNILSFLPSQEQQSATASNQGGSILPTVNISTPTYAAPTAATVNAGSFGNNLTGYNAAVQSAEQGLTSNENSEYSQAMANYEQNMQQFGNLTGVYNNLANTYNIPGYQQDVVGLQGLLQNLNQDVNAQTTLGGGLMTESARDENYANRAQPLNMALSNASQELGAGQTDVNNLMNAYETSLTNALKLEELDLSNLPTLFGQTNEAAEAGYGQGQSAIESGISNTLQAQEVQAQQEQASAAMKSVNAEYGTGTAAGSIASGQVPAGMSLKNATAGAGQGYDFSTNGQPTSAASFAAANGINPAALLGYMSAQGDTTAKSAYNYISANPNANITELQSKFPSLFWGM